MLQRFLPFPRKNWKQALFYFYKFTQHYLQRFCVCLLIDNLKVSLPNSIIPDKQKIYCFNTFFRALNLTKSYNKILKLLKGYVDGTCKLKFLNRALASGHYILVQIWSKKNIPFYISCRSFLISIVTTSCTYIMMGVVLCLICVPPLMRIIILQ